MSAEGRPRCRSRCRSLLSIDTRSRVSLVHMIHRLDTPADNIEALSFELSQPNSKKILFGAIYRPPNLDASTFTDLLEEMLNNHVNESLETVLLGIFNFDYTSPNAAT